MSHLQVQGLLLGGNQLSIKFRWTQLPRRYNGFVYQLIHLPIPGTHSKESQRNTSTDPRRIYYTWRYYHCEVGDTILQDSGASRFNFETADCGKTNHSVTPNDKDVSLLSECKTPRSFFSQLLSADLHWVDSSESRNLKKPRLISYSDAWGDLGTSSPAQVYPYGRMRTRVMTGSSVVHANRQSQYFARGNL